MSVNHYENFPVASVLCPPQLRPAVVALYHFARTADDLADEGDALPAERLQWLQRYRDDLLATFAGGQRSGLWEPVFVPLARARDRFALPLKPLEDLLDAFMQDTSNPVYDNREQLLDYCRRSANPVGRLLMHLYGRDDAELLKASDDICTALQLINFWQDMSVDLPRGRVYVPRADATQFGIALSSLNASCDSMALRQMVRALCDWARQLMLRGAPLASSIAGRSGWELRLVVAGGLRILDKIQAIDHATALKRPKLNAWDLPALLWRASTLPARPSVPGPAL